MCGILGIIGGDATARERAVARALPTLEKRGPDGNGSMAFAGAMLGHARLSIIDLATGDQPMRDNARDIAISFNGEIFNYKTLRQDLEQKGHTFSTASDTEVILKAYIEYGDSCPEHLDGQFAFALWDNEKQRLFMARDRFGEKPFFYHHKEGLFLFASEIKALLATDLISKELDRTSLDNYLAMYFIPPWRTIYKDITPLPPAHRAVFQGGKLTVERYWSLKHEPLGMSFDDAARQVREILAKSVESRLVADVEVGVFLSGGMDSGIVTALAQASSKGTLKSFSAGFDEHINELPEAREIAKHTGTEHYERNIPVSLDDIREVTRYFDEPLGDSSSIPTSLIAKLAREKVTVALSGDGGDELFMGYGHYRAHWHLPAYKKALAMMLGYTPEKLYKRSHLNMFSVRERARLWKGGAAEVERDPTAHVDLSEAQTPLQKLNLLDFNLKLPGDMLTKVDRSSMMRSLEVRSPFLNHELAQFAFNLPDEYKTSRTRGKIIFQAAFGDLLPKDVFTRKKQGFGAPVKHWLKEKLVRTLLMEMFKEPRLGLVFNTDALRSYAEAFYAGDETLGYKLWMLFALELWMREHEGAYALR